MEEVGEVKEICTKRGGGGVNMVMVVMVVMAMIGALFVQRFILNI